MKFIFVGNPGTGKSTFLNGVFGEVQFRAGIAVGEGITSKLEWKTHSNGDEFADTPGLADVKLREDAAKAITGALKSGTDEYKIIFFMTEEAGRVRPADVQTIHTVISAVKEIQDDIPYGIVINKLSKKLKKKYLETIHKVEGFVTPKIEGKEYPPKKMYLALKNDDLEDEDDCLWEVDDDFKTFLYEDVPSIRLEPEKVSEVCVKDYDESVEKYETELRELRENNNKMMEKLAAINKRKFSFGSLIGEALGTLVDEGINLFVPPGMATVVGSIAKIDKQE